MTHLRRGLYLTALALVGGAVFFYLRTNERLVSPDKKLSFVSTSGSRFIVNNHPIRFAGANVSVMYRDEDRARMPETLRHAAQAGIGVIRVWASGEGGPDDIGPVSDFADWPRTHPFRWTPRDWNEEAFVHLDDVLAEAAHNQLRVQLCLANWWRDTGGVTQYLRWAGIDDAADASFRYGINPERAMLFYTNEQARRLYREHIEKVVLRRNTITGVLYRDDPTIFGWELMNEAQAITGRWSERRAWIREMSGYLKSLDPNHIIAPGDWGYRTAAERREWLADHALLNIDYCDIHNYPRDDTDSFVDSPTALREFIDNRAAAAFMIGKPFVFGEFGMALDGYKGFSQAEWFRAFFESNVRAGSGGAMFWILTPDPRRGYGVTYSVPRDQAVFAEIRRAAEMFAKLRSADPPVSLMAPERHLVPRQFAWNRWPGDPETLPETFLHEDKTLLYRFRPLTAIRERFEKVGSGPGYIWGFGVGYIEYVVPARQDRRRVGEIRVRAHIQPVPPIDTRREDIKTRVTLFINGVDCGSFLVSAEEPGRAQIQEWRVSKFFARLPAMRAVPLTIRFEVKVDADWPYGVNISNWPEGYNAGDSRPVEVEIRR